MIVQAPSVLAQLPRPLGSSNGQLKCGQVHSILSTRKRKRHEVAVGIDGEAINIYNVQSGKLRASYAVPPQSSFTCQPCSVRYSEAAGKTSERKTYCAFAAPEAEIWCFSEKETSTGKPEFSTAKFSLDEPENPVIFLDTILDANNGEKADLLVVRKDGKTERISSGLQRRIWSINCCPVSSAQSGSKQVINATTASAEDAETGIFKKRPDLVSRLSTTSAPPTTVLLLLVRSIGLEGSSRQTLSFQVHMVPGSLALLSSQTDLAKPLFESQFPKDHDRWSLKPNSQITFEAGRGTIDVAFEKGIITYDLTGYSPEIISQLLPETEVFSSLLRLSPSLVVAASTSAISLYDAKYHSALERLPTDQVLLNRKRKRATGQSIEQPIIFVSYFSRLGYLIALRGNTLLSLDLGADRSPNKSTERRKDGYLINAIGKGLPATGVKESKKPKGMGPGFSDGAIYRNQEDIERWSSRKSFLDGLIEVGDFKTFENELALDLFSTPGQTLSVDDAFESETLGLPEPQKVLFALSRCFPLVPVHNESIEDETYRVQVRVGAPRLLHWLIKHDWISLSNISTALNMNSANKNDVSLSTGSIHQALIEADLSLTWLEELSQNTRSLETTELVSIIREHITSALTLSVNTGEVGDGTNTTKLVNGHSAESDSLALAKTSPSEATPSGRHRTIVLHALEKLNGRSKPELVAMIRSGLPGNNLLAVIQFLRLQLFQGGYTTSFRSQPISSTSLPLQDPVEDGLELDVVIGLLSCCIDALGPSTALSADDNFTQSMLIDLRSEISSALEGVEEATYLQGILREVWRYSTSGVNKSGLSDDRQDSEAQAKSGDIITLFSEALEEQFDNTATSGMLPLSLKMEAGISDYKVRKGGGQILQRSGREKAALQSRAVGKYSLDRLVL